MRVDLLVTDRPITPCERGAPRLTQLVRSSDRQAAVPVKQPCDLKSGRDPSAPENTKDPPFGGGPSRKLNNIIGVQGYPESFGVGTTASAARDDLDATDDVSVRIHHVGFASRITDRLDRP